ncbi:helix-turn-helix domain-containing protein [Streptomyces sp. NPDC052236]|uniref:helix-turn-helix domain-containing protein n=1 Tax=Streptomyces sp. NPDC052236 TaxID=3365686 RepID=UPI0037D6A52A
MSVGPVSQDPFPEASVTPLPKQAKPEAAARLLGEELRHLRLERNLTLEAVGKVIRASASKISRLERGMHPPRERDIYDLVRFFQLGPEEERVIDALLRQAQYSAWYKQYSDVTPTYLKRLIGLEGSAHAIYTYENHVVPGLLQTPQYARAVVEAALPQAPGNERRVELRMGRQELLHCDQCPQVVALLDEGVLRRPVGGYEVMCGQLEHLLEASDIQGINIRIVEFEASALASPTYPITHLRFSDGGPSEVVYVEHIDSAIYLTRPSDVERYRHVLNQLAYVAAPRERSKELLRGALKRYRKMVPAGPQA